jgi:hypothetical protein
MLVDGASGDALVGAAARWFVIVLRVRLMMVTARSISSSVTVGGSRAEAARLAAAAAAHQVDGRSATLTLVGGRQSERVGRLGSVAPLYPLEGTSGPRPR